MGGTDSCESHLIKVQLGAPTRPLHPMAPPSDKQLPSSSSVSSPPFPPSSFPSPSLSTTTATKQIPNKSHEKSPLLGGLRHPNTGNLATCPQLSKTSSSSPQVQSPMYSKVLERKLNANEDAPSSHHSSIKKFFKLLLKSFISLKFLLLIILILILIVAYTKQPYRSDQTFVVQQNRPAVKKLNQDDSYVYINANFQKDTSQRDVSTSHSSPKQHKIVFSIYPLPPEDPDAQPILERVYTFSQTDTLHTEVVLSKPKQLPGVLRIWHDFDDPLIFQGILVQSNNFLVKYRILMGFLLLVALYAALIMDVYPRTIAVLVFATIAILLEGLLHIKPTITDVIGQFVDWETIMLVFSMMIIVQITSTTGVFQWLAIKSFHVSKGKLTLLMFMMATFSWIAGYMIDTTTLMLLLVPLIGQLCQVTKSDEIATTLFLLLYANIATACSALSTEFLFLMNYPGVRERGANFFQSLLMLLPYGILMAVLLALPGRWILRGAFQKSEEQKLERGKRARTIFLWTKLLRRLSQMEMEEESIREQIKKNILMLETRISDSDSVGGGGGGGSVGGGGGGEGAVGAGSHSGAAPHGDGRSSDSAAAPHGAAADIQHPQKAKLVRDLSNLKHDVTNLQEKIIDIPNESDFSTTDEQEGDSIGEYHDVDSLLSSDARPPYHTHTRIPHAEIQNKWLLLRCILVIVGIFVFFCINSFMPWMHVSFSFIAFAGAVLLFLSTSSRVTEHTFESLEFDTLLYFAALFAFMASLSRIGLFNYAGDLIVELLAKVPNETAQCYLTLSLLMVVSVALSYLIDNLAYATFMTPIIISLADRFTAIPIQYMIITLHLASVVGGMGTIIGCAQNVLCVNLLKNRGERIGFRTFAWKNLSFVLLSTIVGWGYIIGVYAIFG